MLCEDTRRTRVLLDRHGIERAARQLPPAQRGARGRRAAAAAPGGRAGRARLRCRPARRERSGRAADRGRARGGRRGDGASRRRRGRDGARRERPRRRALPVRRLPAAARRASCARSGTSSRGWPDAVVAFESPRRLPASLAVLAEVDPGAARGRLPRADEALRGGRPRTRCASWRSGSRAAEGRGHARASARRRARRTPTLDDGARRPFASSSRRASAPASRPTSSRGSRGVARNALYRGSLCRPLIDAVRTTRATVRSPRCPRRERRRCVVHRLLLFARRACRRSAVAAPASAWTWPADGAVLRPFALGDDPYAAGQHRGVDVAGPRRGRRCARRRPATVTFAGLVPTDGRAVTIATADGYAVTLVHLGSLAVAEEAIRRGGSRRSGRSARAATPSTPCPYVHLGVRVAVRGRGLRRPAGLLLPPRGAGAPARRRSGAAPVQLPRRAPVAPSPSPAAPASPRSAAPRRSSDALRDGSAAPRSRAAGHREAPEPRRRERSAAGRRATGEREPRSVGRCPLRSSGRSPGATGVVDSSTPCGGRRAAHRGARSTTSSAARRPPRSPGSAAPPYASSSAPDGVSLASRPMLGTRCRQSRGRRCRGRPARHALGASRADAVHTERGSIVDPSDRARPTLADRRDRAGLGRRGADDVALGAAPRSVARGAAASLCRRCRGADGRSGCAACSSRGALLARWQPGPPRGRPYELAPMEPYYVTTPIYYVNSTPAHRARVHDDRGGHPRPPPPPARARTRSS